MIIFTVTSIGYIYTIYVEPDSLIRLNNLPIRLLTVDSLGYICSILNHIRNFMKLPENRRFNGYTSTILN